MEAIADSLGTACKWLVIVGIVLFVAGLVIQALTPTPAGPAADKSPGQIIGEIVMKAFKIVFSDAEPIGKKVSAGGVLLIGLGLLSGLGALAALGAAAATGGSGGGSSPSPTPSGSSTAT